MDLIGKLGNNQKTTLVKDYKPSTLLRLLGVKE